MIFIEIACDILDYCMYLVFIFFWCSLEEPMLIYVAGENNMLLTLRGFFWGRKFGTSLFSGSVVQKMQARTRQR